jgi:hypothetical protein
MFRRVPAVFQQQKKEMSRMTELQSTFQGK